MPLVGCFATPHPPIIVAEVGGEELAQVEATVQAMTEAGREAKRLAPDTFVLLSPHAPLARMQMGVSLASSYHGSLAMFRAPQVTVDAEGDRGLAENILEEAAAQGIPMVLTAEEGDRVELDHGSMVPLYYLTRELGRPVKLVLLSFSYLSLEEHVSFGRAVARAMMASPDRVVYVASSDLSHRLLPGAPAGYDPRGAQFDRAVAENFARGDWEGLMSIDQELVRAAGECGYRSLAVLTGVVGAVEASGAKAQNRLLSYEGPFGVGYLVGTIGITPAGEPAQVGS